MQQRSHDDFGACADLRSDHQGTADGECKLAMQASGATIELSSVYAVCALLWFVSIASEHCAPTM